MLFPPPLLGWQPQIYTFDSCNLSEPPPQLGITEATHWKIHGWIPPASKGFAVKDLPRDPISVENGQRKAAQKPQRSRQFLPRLGQRLFPVHFNSLSPPPPLSLTASPNGLRSLERPPSHSRRGRHPRERRDPTGAPSEGCPLILGQVMGAQTDRCLFLIDKCITKANFYPTILEYLINIFSQKPL